jgi:hypothetical protein
MKKKSHLVSHYYGPANAGPFFEISLKSLHDLLRGSMGIKELYSNEERRVLVDIRSYYLFVIKVYISFIFL